MVTFGRDFYFSLSKIYSLSSYISTYSAPGEAGLFSLEDNWPVLFSVYRVYVDGN